MSSTSLQNLELELQQDGRHHVADGFPQVNIQAVASELSGIERVGGRPDFLEL
jgi:hypothetical protein